ncbi:MAG: putative endonuclease [Frankiales bacterium]|nr:putative endonuclease [Frankiales bacterium]
MTPEKLASWVDRSLSKTEGMLFTATPAEELDAIGRWQQLKDQAFAGQMREIVAAFNRATAHERGFAADEVGLAVRATTTTGGKLVQQALSIAELPGLLEAVEVGTLTEWHVYAVLSELDVVELTLEQRQAVVLVMLARFNDQAPGELGRLVRRLIVQVDRAAAAARDAKATRNRRVWFSGDVDGQAVVTARGPAAAIAAIRASLEATLPDDAAPGEERRRDAREFDLFVDLLTGGAEAGSWSAGVVVPFSVADGGDLELAEIPGLGAILPSTARDLLEQCETVSQIAVDADGVVVAVGDPIRTARQPVLEGHVRLSRPVLADPIVRTLTAPPVERVLVAAGYRFPPRLQRFLEARDRTCVFPGCNRQAMKTDKDHRIPWPAGPTSADNGQCLCRHHHRAKQAVFSVSLDSDGSYRWTTRGGWEFLRHPKGY